MVRNRDAKRLSQWGQSQPELGSSCKPEQPHTQDLYPLSGFTAEGQQVFQPAEVFSTVKISAASHILPAVTWPLHKARCGPAATDALPPPQAQLFLSLVCTNIPHRKTKKRKRKKKNFKISKHIIASSQHQNCQGFS